MRPRPSRRPLTGTPKEIADRIDGDPGGEVPARLGGARLDDDGVALLGAGRR
ncbi:hypothetical protein [Streptomyces humi]|uniref:hypothetical protein n=1 Tax=Streptomyces humi TaxID=1428620 RepID=UPI00142DA1C5|nr:hypothetical protein [Streptomyces humi]